MKNTLNETTDRASQAYLGGEYFDKLSPEALRDLQSLQHASSYPANYVLLSEQDSPQGVFLILSGEVKLSVNSSDGRRLILRIAKKGEIIGLASALTGSPCEMTAETLYPANLAFISRRDFLNFLSHNPDFYQAVTMELSRHYGLICEQLRIVALSSSAPEKLARLLLDLGRSGQVTESGLRFHFTFTHEEIGEFIGTSRETVTRTLSIFKTRHLVNFNGSTLTIPNRAALENYACI
ncbi:MAG: Crp/Fnr family transcriptional regulator [Terracidiphilus sp.]|jgi:CRP/FNR family transcriptional regulator